VHKRGLLGVQVIFKAQLGLAACHDGQVVLGMLPLPARLAAAEVTDAIRQRWPAPDTVVLTVISELARSGFLLTDLLPADATDDPLGHLLGKIPAGNALAVPLTRLEQLLAEADRHPPGHSSRLSTLARARDIADEICLVSRPLSINVAADAHIAVPASLLGEAARAASALWLCRREPAALSGWHERFLRVYGPGRLVPLLEATDSATGIGLDPALLTDEPVASPETGERHAALTALFADALAHDRTEVAVDDALLARLASGCPGVPAPSEISVRVIATSHDDLAAGRLRLAVVPPGPAVAGSSIGRFARLLPGGCNGQADSGDAEMVAEILVHARVPEGAGLALPSGLAQWRIPVGVPVTDGDLDLGDIFLISDGRRLRCWSARHQREVVPRLYSRLAPSLLPPVAWFLQLVGYAGTSLGCCWSWGPLAACPFQPRVRYGRTILAPARWVLPPSLTAAASSKPPWDAALGTWRTGTLPLPPQVVVTDDGDHRLPLDLNCGTDRELLRRYVRRGLAAVCEQPGGPETVQAVIAGPGGRHVLELVVPVGASSLRPPAPPGPVPPVRTGEGGLFLPGGPWLPLVIRAPFTCHEQVLAQFAAIGRDLAGMADMWFWLRYSDTADGPHLRLRLHGGPEALGGTVLPVIAAWCTRLRVQRLSSGFNVEPYDQEIERYGGAAAIAEAERVFAADSQFALDVLTATRNPDQRLVTAALSAAAIGCTLADGDPVSLGRHHLDRDARRRLESVRPAARASGLPSSAATVPDGVPGAASAAWEARQRALMAYRDVLEPEQRAACASSLVHMHANRLLGDPAAERIAIALAADVLARTASPADQSP
jgi:thiopeptide-type bacteriocin biosynthesis protein